MMLDSLTGAPANGSLQSSAPDGLGIAPVLTNATADRLCADSEDSGNPAIRYFELSKGACLRCELPGEQIAGGDAPLAVAVTEHAQAVAAVHVSIRVTSRPCTCRAAPLHVFDFVERASIYGGPARHQPRAAGMQETSNDVAVVVIPARYGSTRLPGKPLADLGGRPLIEHVWRRSCMAKLPSRVLVATDDERIRSALPSGCEVVMTRADHPSGSDRIAEVAEKLDCGIVVNVQGDLPLLDPSLVDELIELLRTDRVVGLATVAVPIESAEELANPSVVKVACSTSGHALYFSRAPIPHDRADPGAFAHAMRHVGIYAYRRATLLAFARMSPTPLERTEALEQLRALENGIVIGVVRRAHGVPIEVDTPEDLAAVRRVMSAQELATRPEQPQSGDAEATGSAGEVRSS